MKDQSKFSGTLFEIRFYMTKDLVYGRKVFIDRMNSKDKNGFTLHLFRMSVAVAWHKGQ